MPSCWNSSSSPAIQIEFLRYINQLKELYKLL